MYSMHINTIAAAAAALDLLRPGHSFNILYINEEVRHERGKLTDYAWCSNAHDVTAFGEKQVHFFYVWTVATLFSFGVKNKQKNNPTC